MMRLLLFMLLSLAALPHWVRAEALPAVLELQYSVSVGMAQLGSLLTELRRDGEGYQVRSETRAEGMASILLGGSLRENCRFTVTDDHLQPNLYEVVREGRRAYQRSATFDWGSGQIRFSHGEEIAIPDDGYVVDNCSVPFAFMVSGSAVFDRQNLHVVGGKRIRHYESVKVVHEDLETPLGQLDTIRIEQRRVGKPERTLTIWVAPDRRNLPVKIVEQRKSRTTTMMLRSVSGI